jgi:AAA+ ATPase superfamily predicted ATPase
MTIFYRAMGLLFFIACLCNAKCNSKEEEKFTYDRHQPKLTMMQIAKFDSEDLKKFAAAHPHEFLEELLEKRGEAEVNILMIALYYENFDVVEAILNSIKHNFFLKEYLKKTNIYGHTVLHLVTFRLVSLMTEKDPLKQYKYQWYKHLVEKILEVFENDHERREFLNMKDRNGRSVATIMKYRLSFLFFFSKIWDLLN